MISKPEINHSSNHHHSHHHHQHNQQQSTPVASTRKRTYLRPPQVATLQESFESNPLPDASSRASLARQLGVTDRTIQVWFQNRRAKSRKMESISSVLGQTNSFNQLRPGMLDTDKVPAPPRYQATFRTLMTPERFEELRQQQQQQQDQDSSSQPRRRPRSSSKPEPKTLFVDEPCQRALSEGISLISSQVPISSPPVDNLFNTSAQLVSLPVNVLRVGSWTRFADSNSPGTDWDLACYGSPIERQLIWQVQAEGHYFRVQIPFGSIRQLRLSQQVQVETGDIVGQLDVTLEPTMLEFSMWRQGVDNDWVRCGDFSEERQASQSAIHTLQGSHDAFKLALLDLVTLSPELASKVTINHPSSLVDRMQATPQPSLPSLDTFRDITLSPSSTPEPSAFAPNLTMSIYGAGGGIQQAKPVMAQESLFQAPFYYQCEPAAQWNYVQQMLVPQTYTINTPWPMNTDL
ncbi:Homeodomain-like DNA binding domain-containing transcription factor [Phycomyces blakesleeanus]|uniref:Homeodomain-like DNA binding domain-containing transcription factor n=2 Tax=Phycomyces blakesleeanus TaxID=4837 RepID=A0A162V938_PHYB8|nr:Homeodomain-like DNA binding domain-containing transcription factor [Phycomyces blakesleeanus NRRL 1555(-)]OAD80993.1 Homeodomain-like DNA binding domain-containing transcription factor [Phycomyces blakesleeanus NRRL 1555(-)]|eukprot:XP_018299033.1 Homeodomain-like DNA binding domain-containing transcription factor [Phycomyces blakesleeanus NRRL 1555(-)]